MYTQCPECLTVFAIDEAMLELSNGMGRCGRCSTQFDALRTLTDTLPGEPFTALPARPFSPHVPRLTDAVYCPAPSKPDARPGDAPPSEAGPPQAAFRGRDDPAPDPFAGKLPVDPDEDLTAALIADSFGTRFEYDAEENTWLAIEPAPAGYGVEVEPILSPGPDALAAGDGGAQAEAGGDRLHPDEPADLPARAGAQAEPDDCADQTVESSIARLADAAFVDAPPPAPTEPVPEGDASWHEPQQIFAGGPFHQSDAAADDDGARTSDELAPATMPVFTRPRRRWIATANARWVAGCTGLMVLLAAQIAFANRGAVLDNPAARPWLMRVCATLPCHLPPLKDLAKLELLSRDIRPHPDVPGALVITATVRNDAVFPQPYPVVVVKLSDLDDNVVAMRRFRPAEYIPDAKERAAGIAPGATVAVAFEVADPGKQAVAFKFGFE